MKLIRYLMYVAESIGQYYNIITVLFRFISHKYRN